MMLTNKAVLFVRLPLLVVSVVGLFASAAAHIEALAGTDPRKTFKEMWVFQLLLLLVLVPIIIRIFQTKSFAAVLHPKRLTKFVLYALLGYYAINFYWFLFWAAEHLNASMTWRVISAGWVLLFAVAAAFYNECAIRQR